MQTIGIVFSFLLTSHTVLAATVPVKIQSILDPSIQFTAETNVSAVNVIGATKKVTAKVTHDQNTFTFEGHVNPKDLDTGMSMRNQHMLETVFQTEKEVYPEIVFKSTSMNPLTSGQLSGTLSIRNIERPLNGLCKVESAQWHCEGAVSLLDFGVTPPSKFGVTVKDSVKLIVSFKVQNE